MKNKTLLTAVSTLLLLHSAFGQGALTPTGGPAPTMKTLAQIEPRTPISSIGQILVSGSYYLTTNLIATSSGSGITVSANDVTIDLNGFELVGSTSGTSSGVFINGGVSNVRILNGTIRNWIGEGINGGGNPRVRVENVQIINNGSGGIVGDLQAVVINCLVLGNTNLGIQILDDCWVENCQVISNAGNGIKVGDNCSIKNCVVRGNGGVGIWNADTGVLSGCTTKQNTGDNIRLGYNSTITKCAANSSLTGCGINATNGYCTISDCTANANNQNGILGAQRCRISDCNCCNNSQSGIHITYSGAVEHCYCDANSLCGILTDNGGAVDILNNNCVENGVSTLGAGIRASVSSGCKIEGNTVSFNYRGIDVLVGRNIIIKNVAAFNSNTDYNIAAANAAGPIVNVAAVGDISSTSGASQPFANFRY